jgi:hypothetical protein
MHLALVLAQNLDRVVVGVERIHQHQWHIHLKRRIQVLETQRMNNATLL